VNALLASASIAVCVLADSQVAFCYRTFPSFGRRWPGAGTTTQSASRSVGRVYIIWMWSLVRSNVYRETRITEGDDEYASAYL
jgi:hypothetical protein